MTVVRKKKRGRPEMINRVQRADKLSERSEREKKLGGFEILTS